MVTPSPTPPRSRARVALLASALAPFVAIPSANAATPDSSSFVPSPELELADLQELLREGAPELEVAQLQVELARANVRQARLPPNPELDLGWGTIPVGTTNPEDLERPFANVPNYGVGISFPIEIAKRGPRIREARAFERGARAELEAVTRAHALDLAQTLGDLATAALRLEDFEQVVVDLQQSIAATELRVGLSFGVALDVDRLRVELTRAQAQVLVARSDVAAALADCSAQVGRSCEAFASGADARAYLEAWIDSDSAAVDGESLDQRPDLRALAEYGEAANAAEDLARAQAIPDPTLRFGYLHDRFLVAGNQRNSLALSIIIPLPIFDRGQAQRDAAQARQRRINAERGKRLAAAHAQVPALVDQAEIERERRRGLRDEAIPKAKAIVTSMESAVEQRLTSIAEVVQARRVVRELLLEEAEAYAAAYEARVDLLRALAPTAEVAR